VVHFEEPDCEFACEHTPPANAHIHFNGNKITYRCDDGYTAHGAFFWEDSDDASGSHWYELPHFYLFKGGFVDGRTCKLSPQGLPEYTGGGGAPPVCSNDWLLALIPLGFLSVVSLVFVAGRRGLHSWRNRKSTQVGQASPGVTVESASALDSSFLDAMTKDQDKYRHVLDSDVIDFSDVKVLEKVGIGSSAAVFKARMHGTECAVKRLNLMLRNDEERLFKAEVKMLLRLRHPNVVQFYGVSFANDDCYLVTEYCPRGSLYDFLQNKANELPYHLQLRMAADAARGLDFLHQKNTIHRDMKSGNLLVTDSLRLKICDFGISRHANAANTMTASLGTVPWTAPEMLRGDRYSKKVDCYSLGVCIWELVTRRIPYEGVQSVRIITSVINGMRPQIPKTTSAVLTKLISLCWHTKASMRPSAADIVKTLETALANELGGGGAQEVGQEGSLQGDPSLSQRDDPFMGSREIRPAPSSDPGAQSPKAGQPHSA